MDSTAEAPKTREEVLALIPNHPLLGDWKLCNCGHRSCRTIYPSRMGVFYQGSGFTAEEAMTLTAAMFALDAVNMAMVALDKEKGS